MADLKFDRLRKIMELRDRGATEGERSAAQARLDILLAKIGMTESDLLSSIAAEAKVECSFSYTTNHEKTLLFQIIFMIIPDWDGTYYRHRGERILRLTLTVELSIDINEAYVIYRKALQDEMEVLFDAFICRHQIYAPTQIASRDLDPEEIEWLKRRDMMADALNGIMRPFRKIAYQPG